MFFHLGAHLNMYTSHEQTVYYANSFNKDVPTAIDIISDILQSSKLNSSVVEHEHDVILCEQQEVDKQLERWSLTTFMQLLSKVCVPQLFCMQ